MRAFVPPQRQDVSKLNPHRANNMTVIRDGSKRTGLVYVSLMKFLAKEPAAPLHADSFRGGMQGLLLENVLGLIEPPKGLDPETGERFLSNLDY